MLTLPHALVCTEHVALRWSWIMEYPFSSLFWDIHSGWRKPNLSDQVGTKGVSSTNIRWGGRIGQTYSFSDTGEPVFWHKAIQLKRARLFSPLSVFSRQLQILTSRHMTSAWKGYFDWMYTRENSSDIIIQHVIRGTPIWCRSQSWNDSLAPQGAQASCPSWPT